ncbi:MAG: hypothetical protein AAF404_02980, partial [Pseudomonadota bacterium]
CHGGSTFTDSNSAVLHDIGSIMPESGNRLSAALTGIDTPTLLGIWKTAPYLHDGSALTLSDAVSAHLGINLTAQALSDLAAYLQQLDNRNLQAPLPPIPQPPVEPDTPTESPVMITIDGSFDDWAQVPLLASDGDDVSGVNNVLDMRYVQLVNNDNTLYVRISTFDPMQLSWGLSLLIDVDSNVNTGFRGFNAEYPVGVDFLVEGNTLQRYNGSGNDFNWTDAELLSYATGDLSIELAIPTTQINNPATIRLFLLANNAAVNGTAVDYLPDNVINAAADTDTRYYRHVLFERKIASIRTGGGLMDLLSLMIFALLLRIAHTRCRSTRQG